MRFLRSALVIMMTVSLTENADAFNWEAHRQITRNGLVGFDIIAMREIVSGNLSVDQGNLEKQRAPHFDSGHLSDGAAFIKDRLNKASQALAVCSFQHSRKMFGQALHTVQDFYSHSNWVEKNLQNPTASFDVTLAKDHSSSSHMIWIPRSCCHDMGRRECQNVPLTTGFMVKDNLLWRNCTHSQLHKDNEKKRYFPQAVQHATQATRKVFKNFITDLVKQNGEIRTQELIGLFVRSDEHVSRTLCSQKTAHATCNLGQENILNRDVEITVDKILNRLMDDELPADLYN